MGIKVNPIELVLDCSKIMASACWALGVNWLQRWFPTWPLRPKYFRPILAIVLPLLTCLAFWFMPAPDGLELSAWHLLGFFLGTIVSFITKPLPMGALALVALAGTVSTNTLTLNQALTGFSSPTSWLTFSSFLIAQAIIKTGLGTRIAYRLIVILGRNSLALGYGLVITDLLLAPAMPSGNARSGGLIFPVAKSLAQIYHSQPHDDSARRIGSFLSFVAFQGTQITTAMFLTAMVANPLMVSLIGEISGRTIDWFTWSVAAFVPGIASLLLMPWLVYRLYPPIIKQTPEAPHLAKQKLRELGAMPTEEWLMLGIFSVLLMLWIGGKSWNISSVATALVGIALLIITQVLTWEEILSTHKAWNILVWFSILLTMATALNQLGFIAYLTQGMGQMVTGLAWPFAFGILAISYFYSNYFFASKAVRASAMYPAFLTASVAVGTPVLYGALSLAFLTNLSGCLTHYGTAVAPMYFSSGYVDAVTWWKLGLILSLLYLPLWLLGGGLWWHLIGLI